MKSQGGQTPTSRRRFDTAGEAAYAALSTVAGRQTQDYEERDEEHAGYIYRLRSGAFGYTDPVVGYETGVNPEHMAAALALVPRGAVIVGDYHTHCYFWIHMTQEEFSGEGVSGEPGDVEDSLAQLALYGGNYFSYLGTPMGRFIVFDPKTGQTWTYSPSPGLYPAGHGSLSSVASSYAH